MRNGTLSTLIYNYVQKKENVLFNHVLNNSYGYMAPDHPARGNPLSPLYGLRFPFSSKGFYMHHLTDGIKPRSGLEPVPRCQSSNYKPIAEDNHCDIGVVHSTLLFRHLITGVNFMLGAFVKVLCVMVDIQNSLLLIVNSP